MLTLLIASSLLLHVCAGFNIETASQMPTSPSPYATYRTLRHRMLDGSFRRPYRLPSSSILMGRWRVAPSSSADEKATPAKLPYYSGLGKGR